MAVTSHSDRKRGKLPRGPHRLTEQEVADDQRQRLVDAMVLLAGERGYASTTVADIIARAEVSRKTFYAHFADRPELLLAAFDMSRAFLLADLKAAAQRTGGPTRQFEALMRRLCRIAAQSPGTIALLTVEIAAVQPEGFERHTQLMDNYGGLIDGCLGAEDKQRSLPPTLARALAGGTFRTIDARLRTARVPDLSGLASQLARWTRSYHPVPPSLAAALAPSTPWRSLGPDGFLGGRAPGTLTLIPKGYQPPKPARSDGFTFHTNRERILDAVAQLTAAHGYTALTAQSITEQADLSERAFLAHFKSKDHAFAAAVEVGHLKGQAIVERARASTPDWRTGVRRALHALLEFFASEPDFTRLAFVDAPLAGPTLARRTHEHAGAYGRLLFDDAPQRRRPPVIATEASVHGLFELAFHYSARNESAQLLSAVPQATYLVLAPFLGVTEAAEMAAQQPAMSPDKDRRPD
jgi:AcrR family transcriptional regulator